MRKRPKFFVRKFFVRIFSVGKFFEVNVAVVPVGGAETERSFSFLRQTHSWFQTATMEESLGNIEVLAVHGFKFH